MKPIRIALLGLMAVLAGCIVGDQLTTLTVYPDGSADYVVFRSNLHSTQTGDKAEREVAEYRATFDARADDELVRINDAGGEIVETTWLRDETPLSNLLRAHFPDASALERFFTHHGDDGQSLIVTQFEKDGLHRRLAIHVTVEHKDGEPAPVDAAQLVQSQANGLSLTRIAVPDGTITAARGFTVAGDKQSAVMNTNEMAQAIHDGQGTAELFLEWDVAP